MQKVIFLNAFIYLKSIGILLACISICAPDAWYLQRRWDLATDVCETTWELRTEPGSSRRALLAHELLFQAVVRNLIISD